VYGTTIASWGNGVALYGKFARRGERAPEEKPEARIGGSERPEGAYRAFFEKVQLSNDALCFSPKRLLSSVSRMARIAKLEFDRSGSVLSRVPRKIVPVRSPWSLPFTSGRYVKLYTLTNALYSSAEHFRNVFASGSPAGRRRSPVVEKQSCSLATLVSSLDKAG